jgi:hypothetical protein
MPEAEMEDSGRDSLGKKCDARKTVETFSATLRDETDLEWRPGKGGKGDDAASPRLFVVAS